MVLWREMLGEPWLVAEHEVATWLAGVIRDGQTALRAGPASMRRDGSIAVVTLRGMLLGPRDEAYQRVLADLQLAASDPQVAGVLLSVDSPGGVVTGIPQLAEAVRELARRKPVAGVADDIAYSGAYWVLSGATRIFAPQLGGVGSIGAIALHAEISRMLEEAGVRTRLFRWPRRKAEASALEPLSEEAAADLQARVEEAGRLFAQAVARARRLPLDVVTGTEGRALPPEEARELGLIDVVGDTPMAMRWLVDAVRGKATTGVSVTAEEAPRAAPPAAEDAPPPEPEPAADPEDEEEGEEETPMDDIEDRIAAAVQAERARCAELVELSLLAGTGIDAVLHGIREGSTAAVVREVLMRQRMQREALIAPAATASSGRPRLSAQEIYEARRRAI